MENQLAELLNAVSLSGGQMPQREKAISQPEAWDQEWEKLFEAGVLSNLETNFQGLVGITKKIGPEQTHESYKIFLLSTCAIQQRIAALGVRDGVQIEMRWRMATPATRRKHALIGLASACSLTHNLHNARAYCAAELRLQHLHQTPLVLLDLFKAINPGPKYLQHPPDKPYFVPNTDWDAFALKHENDSSKAENITFSAMLILRTKLIYLVVEAIFLSLLGRELPKVSGSQDPMAQIREIVMGEVAKPTFVEDEEAYNARIAKRVVLFCQQCGKVQPPNVKFNYCPPCRKVGRDHLYCSKKCQQMEWKAHKAICGKPPTKTSAAEASGDAQVTETEKENAGKEKAATPHAVLNAFIGPPIEGFKRTPALEEHILYLSKLPPGKADLLVKLEPVSKNIDFVFVSTPGFSEPLVAARKACMTKGDRKAIVSLCHLVMWTIVTTWADSKEVNLRQKTLEAILKQWSEEYDYPLEELRVAVNAAQENTKHDDFRRPTLWTNVSPLAWGTYQQQNPSVSIKKMFTL
ncbi:hypothetical protein CYLTODRAFT_485025 [Cylindrobasidium torrendii FP15055 ss-10]|uniref:MYND-type domain-containing protein n=1 Tax=Cylindrobasidium torrendii FP15055 ss-10 TaxID=1314674 RepID=A0A0D7BUG2_9AGAR|nr:hypothetical protein CYLTODRAFT_485025 [Cylindrobasidium torrendii FP15055 ss-10]